MAKTPSKESIEQKIKEIKEEWKRLYHATAEGKYGNKATILALISLNQTYRIKPWHGVFTYLKDPYNGK